MSVNNSGGIPIPYPADTRAKGWRFELDHERIEQSDTWALAPAEVRPWLLMLWMTAWKQTPCGSLPDSDELIAARLGMSQLAFREHRSVLMRGWWKADDGRLYHPFITDMVNALIEIRTKEANRKSNWRASRGTIEGQTKDAVGTTASVTSQVTGTPPSATTPEPEPEPVPDKRNKIEVAEGIDRTHTSSSAGADSTLLGLELKPADPPPDTVVSFPTTPGLRMFHVDRALADRLQSDFPAVDVAQELRAARAWIEANPKNRKTYNGMTRFLTNWISRKQDRAPRVASVAAASTDIAGRLRARIEQGGTA